MFRQSLMCIKAVDSYMEDPENYVCQQEWIDELWKVAQRELATGFITIHQVKMNNYSANVVKFHNINLLVK